MRSSEKDQTGTNRYCDNDKGECGPQLDRRCEPPHGPMIKHEVQRWSSAVSAHLAKLPPEPTPDLLVTR
jgi:hypothetical protein